MVGPFINGGSFLLLILTLSLTTINAHNITLILQDFPDLSTFNYYLSETDLAPEINQRETITICAVDNSAMDSLISKNLPISSIKNVLSLHVFLDYFDATKLHQITDGTALVATLYQASGLAPGTAGFVNITDLKGGQVAFGTKDSGSLDSTLIQSIKEIPYNISVIQISQVLNSTDATAPSPSPEVQNITDIMSSHGCKAFADALVANPDALSTYMKNVEGGLTVFCPIDDGFNKFMPKYKNLTKDGNVVSLLLYHGVPIYESISMLKSNNGVMNTLATDGNNKFDFLVKNDGNQVTLKSKLDTARITGTLIDEQPLVMYTIDKVLSPIELFKQDNAPAPAPTPAPAPAPTPPPPPASASNSTGESPKGSKEGEHHYASPPAPLSADSAEVESPADSPAGEAYVVADENDGGVSKKGAVLVLWRVVIMGMGSLWWVINLL